MAMGDFSACRQLLSSMVAYLSMQMCVFGLFCCVSFMLSGAADLKLIMFELIWFCNYGFYFYLVVLCVAGIAGFSGVDGHGVGDADGGFKRCKHLRLQHCRRVIRASGSLFLCRFDGLRIVGVYGCLG